jgi:hypothetical protein
MIMLLVGTVLFTAMWILGMISNHTWNGKIHLLLALAITSLVLHMIQRRKRDPGICISNPSHQRRDATLLTRRK